MRLGDWLKFGAVLLALFSVLGLALWATWGIDTKPLVWLMSIVASPFFFMMGIAANKD